LPPPKGRARRFGRDPEGVGPVRHPRRRSARSVEDHFVPRPRQGYVRQRPWRGVRVEGVAAVRLNQCRSEKWRENGMGRDYSGAAENACRQLLLPATRCTKRFAPLSSPVCERTWYLGKGPHLLDQRRSLAAYWQPWR